MRSSFFFFLLRTDDNIFFGLPTPFSAACQAERSLDNPKAAVTTYSVIFLYNFICLFIFCMLVWGWQQIRFVGSLEWMIQKIMTLARGTKSTAIVMNTESNRGGDCTCRGIGSEDCCNVRRFCCGACKRRRRGVSGVSGEEEQEENGARDVDCTGDMAYWGARAGVIVSVILLGIIGGAQ